MRELRRSALLLVIACAAALAQDGRRVALVIGNDAYAAGPLQNAVNDARAMQKSLAGAGFRVILKENANKVAMEEGASEFLQAIGPGDTALFFFAGHAVQIENENLLLPVDFAPGRTVIEAKFRSFSLPLIFDYLKRARAGLTIVVIDACRTNPAVGSHALQAGLAIPLNAGKDTYIAFSTSPNHVAADNPEGRNSWFTENLAQQIAEPGLTLDDVMTRVRLKVESATAGAQTPWSQTSLTNRFYFHPPASGERADDSSMVPKWLSDAGTYERFGDWTESIDSLNRVIKAKQAGPDAAAAQARLPYLQARLDAKTKYDAGDYTGALVQYELAIKLDPFEVDAAFDAAKAALLAEQTSRAAQALQAVRLRGSASATAKADAMLKEIGRVEPTAPALLSQGLPPAPSIQEVFSTFRFGLPDWRAGLAASRQAQPFDYAAVTRQIVAEAAASASAGLPSSSAPETPIDPNAMQVAIHPVSSTGRDLRMEGEGDLAIVSEKSEVAVLINGKPVSRKLPYLVRLPAGKYDVQVMSAGRTLTERQVEIRPGQKVELEVK